MQQHSRRICRLVILVAGCLATVSAIAQQGPISLKQAIDLALTNNRSLRSDSLNMAITDSRNKEIASQYKPHVKYYSVSEYNPAIPSQMLPGKVVGQPTKDLVAVEFGTSYNIRNGIEVSQAIFRKDWLIQMKAAGLYNDIAKTKYTLSREELVYQVASVYYSLQATAEYISATRHDYTNMKEVVSIAQAQVEQGVLKKVDFESLQINLANTDSRLQQLETQYTDQLTYLNYLLGLQASLPTLISKVDESSLKAADPVRNLQQREDVRLSHQMIASKEVELKMINAEKKPQYSSYFRYNFNGSFNSLGDAFNNDYYYNAATVGVSMNLSLFDGNNRRHRTQSTRLQIEQLKQQSIDLQDRAQRELVSAASTLNSYRTQYFISRSNRDLAEKVFNSRKALYAEGVTTLIELLDAERELTQARNNYVQSLINLQSGQLSLHKANGTLLTEFINKL